MVWILLDEPFGFTPNDEREDEIQTARAPQQGQSGALQDGRQEAAFEAVCGMDLSGEQEILRRQGAQMSPASPLYYRRLIARVTRSHLAIG